MGIFLVLAVIFGVVLHATPVGRSIFAIGLQPEAAGSPGSGSTASSSGSYVLSGVVCAFAGILRTLRFATVALRRRAPASSSTSSRSCCSAECPSSAGAARSSASCWPSSSSAASRGADPMNVSPRRCRTSSPAGCCSQRRRPEQRRGGCAVCAQRARATAVTIAAPEQFETVPISPAVPDQRNHRLRRQHDGSAMDSANRRNSAVLAMTASSAGRHGVQQLEGVNGDPAQQHRLLPPSSAAAAARRPRSSSAAARRELRGCAPHASAAARREHRGVGAPATAIKKGLIVYFIPKDTQNPYEVIADQGGSRGTQGARRQGRRQQRHRRHRRRPDPVHPGGDPGPRRRHRHRGQRPDGAVPVAGQALAAGIKVVSFDSDVTCPNHLFINQANTEQIGTSEVDLLAKQISSTGQIAILSAAATATNQNAWIGYMKQQLTKYPNMKLVTTVYGNDDPATSLTVLQGLLSAYPNLRGIISPTTVGISTAAQYLDTHKSLLAS